MFHIVCFRFYYLHWCNHSIISFSFNSKNSLYNNIFNFNFLFALSFNVYCIDVERWFGIWNLMRKKFATVTLFRYRSREICLSKSKCKIILIKYNGFIPSENWVSKRNQKLVSFHSREWYERISMWSEIYDFKFYRYIHIAYVTYKWIKLEREHSIELENEQITFVWIDLPHICC